MHGRRDHRRADGILAPLPGADHVHAAEEAAPGEEAEAMKDPKFWIVGVALCALGILIGALATPAPLAHMQADK